MLKCFQLQRGKGSFFLQVLFHILNGAYVTFNDVFTIEPQVLFFSYFAAQATVLSHHM